ncbi:MAG: ParB/RepB/Spo0J family partition protein [Rhodobacteraceae bacterium]|nr:ParB/RepB/Spo0J family partition protein [Paracoccaceae bacterium]
MSKRHDAVFDDVLSDLDQPAPETKSMTGATRFLKRSTGLGERLSGETEEKTLRWIDPAEARMWDKHNRDYAMLNEDNCRDLIDGIKSQGQQEFPAIVRKLQGEDHPYEVICGARRHFAISWLRAHNYTQFKYLVEVRDVSDEEAFRLADIENRDREDISDYERAIDYARAVQLYYGGKQKAMAARLEVSEAWLSRYLNLAKLPQNIVAAFFRNTEIKELHARVLKPLLANPRDRRKVEQKARVIAEEQRAAREGQGGPLEAAQVVARLKASVSKPKPRKATAIKVYGTGADGQGVAFHKKGRKMHLEFSEDLGRAELGDAIQQFMNEFFPSKLTIGKK